MGQFTLAAADLMGGKKKKTKHLKYFKQLLPATGGYEQLESKAADKTTY